MPHPDWDGQSDWEPTVTSVAVASGGARILLDPLAPPPSARAAWERIEAFAPDTAIVLKPDHVRDVDLFVRWYGVRALGPVLYWRDDIPKTELEQTRPGDDAPRRPAGVRRRPRDARDAGLPARAAGAGVRRRA